MTIQEKKVDAIARYLLSNNPATKKEELDILRDLMDGKRPAGDIYEEIGMALWELGIPEHLVGHRYIVEAVRMVVENENMIHNICNGIYPLVANKCGATKGRVERAIRHAIFHSVECCPYEVLYEYFGNAISEKTGSITNGAFIGRLASVIRERTGG